MKRWIALLLIAAVLLASGCTAARQDRLYLYGEFHANDELLQRELALWKDYYAGGMRDLFVELPYYTAQYLNRWMQADNDRILMEVYTDWKGSASYHQNVLDFYRGIKEACPETVFHGTDAVSYTHLDVYKRQNLSNSVAIGVFEALRQLNFPHLRDYGKMKV